MKKISIKTVDGGRFDYTDKDNLIPSIYNLMNGLPHGNFFYGFPVENGIKFFNIQNIVSITEKEVDDG